MRDRENLWVELRRADVAGFHSAFLCAIPLVESLVVGKPTILVANVPLAIHGRRVVGIGEEFCDGVFPRSHSLRLAGSRNFLGARPNRETTGHQRRSSWGALILDVKVRKSDALSGKIVDAWGPHRTALDTDIAIAPIVNKDVDDVRLVDRVTRPERTSKRHKRQNGNPDNQLVPNVCHFNFYCLVA
jgi:hypothetical protein